MKGAVRLAVLFILLAAPAQAEVPLDGPAAPSVGGAAGGRFVPAWLEPFRGIEAGTAHQLYSDTRGVDSRGERADVRLSLPSPRIGAEIAEAHPDLLRFVEGDLGRLLPALIARPIAAPGGSGNAAMLHLSLLRSSARVAVALGRHLEEAGEVARARRIYRDVVRMGVAAERLSTGASGSRVEQAVAASIENQGAVALAASLVASGREADPAELEGIARDLDGLESARVPLSAIVARERFFAEDIERLLETEGGKATIPAYLVPLLTTETIRKALAACRAESKSLFAELTVVCGLPYRELRKRWSDWESKVRDRTRDAGMVADLRSPAEALARRLLAATVPSMAGLPERHLGVIARLRGTALLARLAIRRKADGTWPRSLEGIRPAPGLDPFTDKPYVYESKGAVPTLRSVGPDLARDRAAAPGGDDIVLAP